MPSEERILNVTSLASLRLETAFPDFESGIVSEDFNFKNLHGLQFDLLELLWDVVDTVDKPCDERYCR
jgi:hypothetical protein